MKSVLWRRGRIKDYRDTLLLRESAVSKRYASIRRRKCSNNLATPFKTRGVAQPATRMRVVMTMPPPCVAVRNIARRLGDDISEEKPILDSRLPDGSRVAAVIRPCSLQGVTLTIRKFNAKHFQIEDLIRIGTITQEVADVLKQAVIGRQNILISGGTGTGKTTLLNILANFIPEHERILVIEDTAEIQITTPNLVRFEARREQDGLPAVTIRDLLKASLRHRPDRILLGEIRGAEAFDLLQLLNTGHSGTISTVHANSAQQALSRFTSCVLQSNVELPYRAIKSNIADSLNLLIHVERRSGRRFLSELLRIEGYNPDDDHYAFEPIFMREQQL